LAGRTSPKENNNDLVNQKKKTNHGTKKNGTITGANLPLIASEYDFFENEVVVGTPL
jgi:predicted transcriptional regulator